MIANHDIAGRPRNSARGTAMKSGLIWWPMIEVPPEARNARPR